jgi:serine/threonine protein kinase
MGSVPPRIGTLIAGKYRIERVIGDGGMGIVVVATDTALRRRVAVKVLRPDRGDSSPAAQRFLREARASAAIESEHVARVFEVGETDNGAPYLVMEYLRGRTLADLIAEREQLPIEHVIDLVVQTAEGLAAAHARGIVHRDVKPANVFLARLPDRREVVKVLDFGISKTVLTLSPKLTAKGQLMGTPFYMSPEQLLSASDVDQRTDIWSLGVIVHELLTGHRPFTGETLTELIAAILEDEPPAARAARSDVPEQLDALIGRCLAKDPTQRPADLGEFVEALGAFGTERHRQAAERIRATLRFAGGDPSSMQKRPDDGEVERPSGEASTVEDEGRQSSARPAAGEPDAAQSTLGSAHWSNARERDPAIRHEPGRATGRCGVHGGRGSLREHARPRRAESGVWRAGGSGDRARHGSRTVRRFRPGGRRDCCPGCG